MRCNLQQLSCDWCLHSCRDLSSPHLRFYPLPAGRVCLFTGLYLVAQIYKFWKPRFTINKTNSYKRLAIIWMCKSHKSFIFGSNPSSISCKYMRLSVRRCCIDIIRASPLQDSALSGVSWPTGGVVRRVRGLYRHHHGQQGQPRGSFLLTTVWWWLISTQVQNHDRPGVSEERTISSDN